MGTPATGRGTACRYGGAGLGVREDAFNFYQSSLRITVECTFGELAARWGVLSRPLRVSLPHVTGLLQCICHLHNVCKDFRVSTPAGMRADAETARDIATGDRAAPPDWRVETHLMDPSDLPRSHHRSGCVVQPLRERLASALEEANMWRPSTSRFTSSGATQRE
eukprot:SAG25_NODE_599_length_6648_cov_22.861964_7_plen_165_part_00